MTWFCCLLLTVIAQQASQTELARLLLLKYMQTLVRRCVYLWLVAYYVAFLISCIISLPV